MEAPKPRAGPFIAATMGFLKWMKANTNSLKGPQNNQYQLCRVERKVTVHGGDIFSLLPYGVGDAAALFSAIGGQTANQVRGLQAAAEHRPHGAEQ